MKDRHKKRFHEGTVVGTIRPIGLRPPEAKKPKTAEAAEVAPEAKKFLHFALEAALAPEVAVADSEMKGEGASSSSSGAMMLLWHLRLLLWQTVR